MFRKEGLTINTHIGNEKWNQAAAVHVRMEVFVLERGIALRDEFDAYDHDNTISVVIYDEDRTVATGRYVQIDSTTIRPGRIAVLKEYRKQGLGERVIKEMEVIGKENGCISSVIHGELSAAEFYEKLGYIREPGLYYEDGAACVTLKKLL